MHRSVVVILSAGGAVLDVQALAGLPLASVERVELARGDTAAAAAATVAHECVRADLARAVRSWADGRGWSVTVAPLSGRD